MLIPFSTFFLALYLALMAINHAGITGIPSWLLAIVAAAAAFCLLIGV